MRYFSVHFFKIVLKLTLCQTLVEMWTYAIASPEISDSQEVYLMSIFKIQNVKWFDKSEHEWSVVKEHGRDRRKIA